MTVDYIIGDNATPCKLLILNASVPSDTSYYSLQKIDIVDLKKLWLEVNLRFPT